MALQIAKYIQAANVADNSIRFQWDDWNVEQAEEPVDEELRARLRGVSLRANIALVTATAEWIVARFTAVENTKLYWNYLESAWAAVVDIHYCRTVWEDFPHGTEFTGPVRGPLGIAMIRVQYAIGTVVEGRDPELRAAWIHNLAQYLLTDPKPYQAWYSRIVQRLESLYPRTEEDPLGEVVPREALDPARDFNVEETETLINSFLTGLDYNSNEFLNPPEEMLLETFKGVPYKFDILADRKARREG